MNGRSPKRYPPNLPKRFLSKTSLRARWGAYRDAVLELGDSLLAFFVLEAVIGLLNSFMLAGSIDFEGSGAVSAAAIVGAIVVFCFIVFVAHRIPKVSTVSRVVMPVLAAMLVFLPFLSERYNLVFSMLLLGSYYFVALLITYLIAEAAQTRAVSPSTLMGGMGRAYHPADAVVGVRGRGRRRRSGRRGRAYDALS